MTVIVLCCVVTYLGLIVVLQKLRIRELEKDITHVYDAWEKERYKYLWDDV